MSKFHILTDVMIGKISKLCGENENELGKWKQTYTYLSMGYFKIDNCLLMLFLPED